jgi:hypothetical protein
VFKERLTFARWLRTCPVCRSDAVREVRSEPVDEGLVHCLVSCGQCETWRAVFATCRAGRRLERRLERRRGRDQRQITRALHAWATDRTISATSVERAADPLGLANDGAVRMDP